MKVKLLLALLLLSKSLSGQVINLFHLNQKEDIKHNTATEIEEELKFTNYSIKYSKKLNNHNQLIEDERHNMNGDFLARFTYNYDSITSLKTSRRSEVANESGNPTINTEKYTYDRNGHLIKVEYLFGNNTIARVTKVVNNALGQPVRLEEYDSKRILMKSTLIEYNYQENRATYSVFDSDGNKDDSGFFIIDYDNEKDIHQDGFVYNENGDLIKTPGGYNEIEYDDYGNWIKIKRYDLVDGKSILNQEQTRDIKYSN